MGRLIHRWGQLVLLSVVLVGCGSSAARQEQRTREQQLQYTQRLLVQQENTIQMLYELMRSQQGMPPRYPTRAPVDWHDAAPTKKDPS